MHTLNIGELFRGLTSEVRIEPNPEFPKARLIISLANSVREEARYRWWEHIGVIGTQDTWFQLADEVEDGFPAGFSNRVKIDHTDHEATQWGIPLDVPGGMCIPLVLEEYSLSSDDITFNPADDGNVILVFIKGRLEGRLYKISDGRYEATVTSPALKHYFDGCSDEQKSVIEKKMETAIGNRTSTNLQSDSEEIAAKELESIERRENIKTMQEQRRTWAEQRRTLVEQRKSMTWQRYHAVLSLLAGLLGSGSGVVLLKYWLSGE